MTTTTGVGARGEAGRRGPDVRSDVHAAVELAAPGAGLQVEVRSRVEALYGDRIRESVTETLTALGVRDARVAVEDAGALPWVIQARVEAAARAAGAPISRGGPGIPSFIVTNRDRLRRSRLYLPGNEPKFMVNAGLHRPDGVILDLEDSVHRDAKPAARILVRNALATLDFAGAERMVRINQLPLGLEDLDAVVPAAPDLILIPKVESAEQVAEVDARVRALTDRRTWLMPILESAVGVERAFEIASASDAVVALTIGLEDYTADLGVVKTREGVETAWARQRLVNAARAAGVQAIDSVYGDVADEDGLLAWGRASRALGFVGMGCIHPRQIAVIHQAFAPTPEEIERAMRITEAFQDAEARGLSVVSLGSKMIDPPVVLRARRLVERAREMGLLVGGDA
jgi:citrate lyase subunit beta / citryl-CoA lyase